MLFSGLSGGNHSLILSNEVDSTIIPFKLKIQYKPREDSKVQVFVNPNKTNFVLFSLKFSSNPAPYKCLWQINNNKSIFGSGMSETNGNVETSPIHHYER